MNGWILFPTEAIYERGEERRGVFTVATHNSVAESSLSETERGGRKEKVVVGTESRVPTSKPGRNAARLGVLCSVLI